jgi:acetyltransferase
MLARSARRNADVSAWHDAAGMEPAHPLRAALAPRSVAVVGASERAGALGNYVFSNLLAGGFAGPIWPINPKYDTVFGRTCFDSVEQLPEAPDLVIITTPARSVPSVIEAAGRRGALAALVLSAGFAEAGDEGRALQQTMLARARDARLRVIGPNCLGLLRPALGLNATFARSGARPGSVALVSQSGAVVAAALDYAAGAAFGFSSVVSTGAAADVDFADVLDFLALDPATRSIVLYVEGIHDARGFLSSVRAASSAKPVVVLKVGRHVTGSSAAMSHTGALAGNDAVFDAALRRAGAIRVHAFDQLFAAAQTLAAGRLPQSRVSDADRVGTAHSRLAVITNGGGPGVLAADAVVDNARFGVRLAGLSPAALERLNALLPPHWPHANPVDIIGDADAARFARALQILVEDEANDGVLLLFCPTVGLGADDTARALLPVALATEKPVVTAWLGGEDARRGRRIFNEAGLPTAVSPERGVEAFANLAGFVRHRELRLQVPGPLVEPTEVDATEARRIIGAARAAGRVWLSELESKQVLAAFGIPTTRTAFAATADAAGEHACAIGFPVAVKIVAAGVTHKTEVGGVMLNVPDGEAVRGAFATLRSRLAERAPEAVFEGVLVQTMALRPRGRELLAGIARDPVFGPVLSFGSGGVMVEVQRDTALALPPLNAFLARDLISRTRVARALDAFRGAPPVAIDALIDVLVRLSDLAAEFPAVLELDINPLLADDHGVMALDARIRIAAQGTAEGALAPDLRYSHLAIHPYPKRLEREIAVTSGPLRLRPIRPEDALAERRFIARLSPRSMYLRFHAPLKELTLERLVRFTQIDYDREVALVAIDETDPVEEIRGIARYTRSADGASCEFGVTVEDSWQGRGLGRHLMDALEDSARAVGLASIFGYVLTENTAMVQMLTARGYRVEHEPGEGTVNVFRKRLSED